MRRSYSPLDCIFAAENTLRARLYLRFSKNRRSDALWVSFDSLQNIVFLLQDETMDVQILCVLYISVVEDIGCMYASEVTLIV